MPIAPWVRLPLGAVKCPDIGMRLLSGAVRCLDIGMRLLTMLAPEQCPPELFPTALRLLTTSSAPAHDAEDS